MNDLNFNDLPPEGADGLIEIIGNTIVCTGNYGINSCEVNIPDIQYAYVVVPDHLHPYLYLYDQHLHALPSVYKGFRQTYTELSTRLGFNDDLFFKTISRKQELKQEIWRRHRPQNYTMLSSFNDYEKGFEIQSADKKMISWDVTYEELQKNQYAEFGKTPYNDSPVLTFKYPVRIGNIVVNILFCHKNIRPDVAVQHYYTMCYNEKSNDGSFNELKNQLVRDIGPDPPTENGERRTQIGVGFLIGGINLSISYTNDGVQSFNQGFTSFAVTNKREYPELLIDQEYEKKMVISKVLVLDDKIDISNHYRVNPRVKRRPPAIAKLYKDEPLIWVDDENKIIGFTGGNYSQVFSFVEVKCISIQNMSRAKGPGGAYLSLHLRDNKYSGTILTGEYQCFDIYAEKIREITGIDLVYSPEQEDI